MKIGILNKINALLKKRGLGFDLILVFCWFVPKGAVSHLSLLLLLLSCLAYLGNKNFIIIFSICYAAALGLSFVSHYLAGLALLVISIFFFTDMYLLYNKIPTDKQFADETDNYIVFYIYFITLMKVILNIFVI